MFPHYTCVLYCVKTMDNLKINFNFHHVYNLKVIKHISTDKFTYKKRWYNNKYKGYQQFQHPLL